jgi:hypothetical protein
MTLHRPALFLLLGAAAPLPAQAFTIGTQVTDACHEQNSASAMKAAGWLDSAQMLPVTAEDTALHDALPFVVPEPWDRRTLAVLVGMRDVDLGGGAPGDLYDLSAVQLAPDGQHEHCLRAPGDTGTEGDTSALDGCRAYILGEVSVALQASDVDEEAVTVALWDQTRPVSLLKRPFHIGRALHALQDAFAHTLRDASYQRVRSVFNYLEPIVASDYSPARDGHRHLSEFDACHGSFADAENRTAAAVSASAQLLEAISEGTSSPDALARAASVLDGALAYEPICQGGAAWCDAAEQMLGQTLPASGCAAAPGTADFGLLGLVFGAALIGRRQRRGRPAAAVSWTCLLTALLLAPTAARGGDWAIRPTLNAAASVDRGSAALGVGARFNLTARWELGTTLELNPWFDVVSGRASWGSINAYATASWRWASVEDIDVRSTVGAGASCLLYQTVGAGPGSVGPFFEAGPLSVVFPARWGRFEVRPELCLDVPSLRGVPLVYPQYRLSFGVSF